MSWVKCFACGYDGPPEHKCELGDLKHMNAKLKQERDEYREALEHTVDEYKKWEDAWRQILSMPSRSTFCDKATAVLEKWKPTDRETTVKLKAPQKPGALATQHGQESAEVASAESLTEPLKKRD